MAGFGFGVNGNQMALDAGSILRAGPRENRLIFTIHVNGRLGLHWHERLRFKAAAAASLGRRASTAALGSILPDFCISRKSTSTEITDTMIPR
jgi:hypothetical protein